jgi:lysophospholipase L1-like esterase
LKPISNALKLSLLLNILLFIVCFIFLNKLGGIEFLTAVVMSKISGETRMNSHLAMVKHWESKFETFKHSSDSIIFIGDSITRQIDWAEIFNNNKIVNRSIGGTSFAQMNKVVDIILEPNPRKIFVMLGINSLKNNMSSQDFIDNYTKLVEKIKTNSPNTKVYIQSVLPINQKKGKMVLGKKMLNTDNDEIKEVNFRLQQLAKKLNYTFIDLYTLFIKDGSLPDIYSFDGLHLSGEGYLLWKEVIKEYVN